MQAVAVEYIGRSEQVLSHSPERQLWCAVISRALQDALNDVATISSPPLRDQICEDARNWFIRDGVDFRAACNSAGYDPITLRSRVLRMIGDQPLRFR
ncbi:MAG: hypothetical protein KGJ66_02860 [Alphaproteobacteria bacterium]|nr:hypothetical protein [Alphaproteobacteria bacterium]